MDKISKEIFQRAYQSYLCGGDIYTYKFSSTSELMKKIYLKSLLSLEQSNLINIKVISHDRAKLSLTEKGIEYGNSINI